MVTPAAPKTAKLYPGLAEVFIRPFYNVIRSRDPNKAPPHRPFWTKSLAKKHNLPSWMAWKLRKVFIYWLENVLTYWLKNQMGNAVRSADTQYYT